MKMNKVFAAEIGAARGIAGAFSNYIWKLRNSMGPCVCSNQSCTCWEYAPVRWIAYLIRTRMTK